MARIERFYAGDDSPGPDDLAEPCPFCEGEECTGDGPVCEQAAQDHWDDLQYMHMRGK